MKTELSILKTGISLLLFSVVVAEEWGISITAVDASGIGADHTIQLGTCPDCSDGWKYGEDQYDYPDPFSGEFTNIHFFHLDWYGNEDEDGNICNQFAFATDFRSIHQNYDLLSWGIRGNTGGGLSLDIPLILSWDSEALDSLSSDYELYLYIGENGVNMREIFNITAGQSDFYLDEENNPNVRVLLGACANTGTTTTHYLDADGDGWGSDISNDFCQGSAPADWVENSLDLNDEVFCESNELDCGGNVELGCGCGNAGPSGCDNTCGSTLENDECGVCDGDNSSCSDCAGTPNGDAVIDACDVCGGGCESESGCDICGVCDGDGSTCAEPKWRLQLVAEIDSYDEFENNGNPDWLLSDDQNFLGAAAGGSWGYDEDHDIPEPPVGPSNYISLFFDHPEWDTDAWGAHFTEDIVSDNEDFFSANLTQWNGTVISNVPGSTSITFSVDTVGAISVPLSNYEMYVELDGNYTRIAHEGETMVEFYMDGSGQKDFSVFIGNIVPQSPDNLTATRHYSEIALDWVGDLENGEDLNDIGDRYPATRWHVYRDDEPADRNGNEGVYAPGDGAGGCGEIKSLLSHNHFGFEGLDFTDFYDMGVNGDGSPIYEEYPDEGLLQESTYFYTVTGSNLAGESSYGHTVRMSGGAETFYEGRDSRASATTDDNADPYVILSNNESSDDDYDQATNESGSYRIPHNFHPDANVINISDNGTGSDDDDYPYGIDNYLWTLVGSSEGDDGDIDNESGQTTNTVSFTVANPHENGPVSYTWELYVDTSHPVRIDDENGDGDNFNTCGNWQSEMHMHSDTDSITVTIEEEPNADPVASSALGLIRAGDLLSVVTSDDYDVSDFNDYDAEAQVWYEPHDNNGDENPADLWFSADQSFDDDGECEGDDGEGCDHQTYTWFATQGIAVGFDWEDLDGDGQYSYGEPYTLGMNDELIYDDADLGDYIASGPGTFPLEGSCGSCTDGDYTAADDVDGLSPHNGDNGSYNYNDRDAHISMYGGGDDSVIILTMVVTDVYGDSDQTSLLVAVRPERNEEPSVGDLRGQDTYYISYDKDTRQTAVGGCDADDLNAADSDNDDLDFEWSYEYADAGTDGYALDYEIGTNNSSYSHVQDGSPELNNNGWQDIAYDLAEGDHTFTFTATDSYGSTASSSTTISVRREHDSPAAGVEIIDVDLKYIEVEVSEGQLDPSASDECYGQYYDGDHENTQTIELFRDGVHIETYTRDDDHVWTTDDEIDSNSAGEIERRQIDKNLEAETTYTYSVQSYNSDDVSGDESMTASATTANRPTVDVLTPNGLEIWSINDQFEVQFDTQDEQTQHISKIEVYYLRDGVAPEGECDPGVQAGEYGTDDSNTDDGCKYDNTCTEGAQVLSDTGANAAGHAPGDGTTSFWISDNTGGQEDSSPEVNYDTRVLVRVYDVGDYDGGNIECHQDVSESPFTMASHTLHHDFDAGWHLFGPALEIYQDELDLVDHLQAPDNMGNWGQDWVAYDVGGTYDGLTLNLGEGYYLAVADGATMEVRGNPVIGDPVGSDGDTLANLSLAKGWNLIANPLVNKISKGTLTINDGSGDKEFEDAVDAGWIAPTIYGWFENSYVSIDRIMPFGGYWINTSRGLTVKVRPHLFEDSELTRKVENMAGKLEIKARDISGDGSSDFVTIGIDDNANNEFSYGEDEYDLPRQAYASMGGEYIDLKIGTDLMKDIRSAEYEEFQVWTISIESEKVDNDIELSWSDVSGFEDDLHMVVNGEAINMHEENYIELTSMIEEVAIVVGNIDSYLNPIPEEFGLSAAYPNPFNPTTNLGLALNADGYVSMSVFNIRGQVVEVLVDRNMKAGYHNITWNADGISSGMYFVRVETGVNTAMQKLMLLK